jgi:hypothetical protein
MHIFTVLSDIAIDVIIFMQSFVHETEKKMNRGMRESPDSYPTANGGQEHNGRECASSHSLQLQLHEGC